MSQPANDEFSQHLSDEESNHEDASDTGAAPKQQQQMILNKLLALISNSQSERRRSLIYWAMRWCITSKSSAVLSSERTADAN
ncbi:hypothetical protein Tco_0605311 [Tanacetum coccineum]